MIKRNLLPGSEWLYCKLYTGIKSADKILVETIKPFTERLKSSGLITDFFFIRYNDPKFHVRLRLKLSNPQAFNGIMSEFIAHYEPLYNNALLTNIVFDSYKRELDRYGEISMETVEKLFCIDSMVVVNLIERLRERGDSDRERWLLSMILIDNLLETVGYDIKEKSEFLTQISDSFNKEFGLTSKLMKPLNDKYRNHRKEIEDTLAHKGIYDEYNDIFIQRKQAFFPLVETLKSMNEKTIQELLPSLIHMTMNRVFRSNNRLCEMVVYYLMNKYYISQIAQQKYK